MAVAEMLASVPLWIAGPPLLLGALHYFLGIKIIPNVSRQFSAIMMVSGLILTAGSVGAFAALDTGGDSGETVGASYQVSPTAIANFNYDSDNDLFTLEQELNTTSGELTYTESSAEFDVVRSDTSTEDATFEVELVNNPEVSGYGSNDDETYNLIAEQTDGTPKIEIIDMSDSSVTMEDRVFSTESGGSQTVRVNVTWNAEAVEKGLEQYESGEAVVDVAGNSYTVEELLTSTVS